MHTPHKGGIETLSAKLHHYALPNLYDVVILLRHTVGIGVVDMQRQYDVDKVGLHYNQLLSGLEGEKFVCKSTKKIFLAL